MLHEITFDSYNGRDKVVGWVYVPACEVAGVVQLVHGFGEHSRRYFHLIVALMDAGYVVAANDHVGHGATAILNNTWGDWGDAGPQTMMEDEHLFMQEVKKLFPDVPYTMFGHSMGSVIARQFCTKYGEELAAVIYCGTTGIFDTCETVAPKIEAAIAEGKANESDPAFAAEFLGWMFARCEEGATLGNEWICHDPYVQKDHAEDPFDAFTHPVHNVSLLDFIKMIQEISSPEWAAKVPADLPILLIAGDQDPVGLYGEGVMQVANWLHASGHSDVTSILYPGYRHEIHNYHVLKFEVEDDIIDFLDASI